MNNLLTHIITILGSLTILSFAEKNFIPEKFREKLGTIITTPGKETIKLGLITTAARNDNLKMTTCDHRILTTLFIISLLRGKPSALFLPRFSAPPIARGR